MGSWTCVSNLPNEESRHRCANSEDLLRPTAAVRHQRRAGCGVCTPGRPSTQNPDFVPPLFKTALPNNRNPKRLSLAPISSREDHQGRALSSHRALANDSGPLPIMKCLLDRIGGEGENRRVNRDTKQASASPAAPEGHIFVGVRVPGVMNICCARNQLVAHP
jgi:hypothetical protein